METPIRKYLKQKEYQRHKVLRRMKKRQQRKAELMLKIAEKLLKRKLPKMDDGTEPKIEYVDLVRIDPVTGEALLSDNTTGSVILPEVTVRPEPKLTKSAYHPEDIELFFNLTGLGMLFNPFRLARTSNLFLGNPSFDNAIEVAHDVLPWSKPGRFLLGAYNLFNEEGIAKTKKLIEEGRYGRAALSGLGDIFNAAMMAEGGVGASKQLRDRLLNYSAKIGDSNARAEIIASELDNSPIFTPAEYKIDPKVVQYEENVVSPVKTRDFYKENYVSPNTEIRAKNVPARNEDVSVLTSKEPYSSPKIDISSKDFYDIVNEDGSINLSAFDKAMNVYAELNNTPYKMNNVVGSELIRKHIMDVVKTAQNSPVPKGYTKQEQVGAALLHDIGKLYGYKNHGTVGENMIFPFSENSKQAVTNVPYRVRDAVKKHMSTKTFRSEDPNINLIRATQFADVGRGMGYDEAALHYPHLLYEREGLQAPQYPKIPLREEIRKYINPWLIDNGYGPSKIRPLTGKKLEEWKSKHSKFPVGSPEETVYTGIPLDATEEEAWAIVEDAIKQHRRVLRGGRASGGSTNMSKETQERLAEVRELDLARTITDRPITDEDRLIWENEHINGTPTGYGRARVFNAHLPEHGLSYNEQYSGGAGETYKLDPDKLDVKYTSLSDDVSDHYASNLNNRKNIKSVAQLYGGVERTPEMSMREYIALNDWDLYSGSKDLPIGMYNMLASPFRLLTGKSLMYESSKGLYPKKKGIPVEKPLTEEEKKIIDDFDNNRIEAFSPEESLYSNTIVRADRLDRLNTSLVRINEMSKRYGLNDFEIKKGKNGEIFYPLLIEELGLELDDIPRQIKKMEQVKANNNYDSLRENVLNFGSSIKDDLDIARKEGFSPLFDFYNEPEDILPDKVRFAQLLYDNLSEVISALDRSNVITEKELTIIDKQLRSGDLDKIIKYIDKHNLMDVDKMRYRMAKHAKESYFDKIKQIREESKKIDLDGYLKEVNDPLRLISIVRKHGAIPRHEMPGFNKTMAILTAGGTGKKGKQLKEVGGDVNRQMATVGKFGEKVLETESNEFGKASGNAVGRGRRDYGKISDKKLTKKTLASILALFTGGSLTKPNRKQNKDN